MTGGSGPDAVRGKTYSQIQIEELELEQRVMRRKPGAEIPTLPTYPRVPGGYVWDSDRGPPPSNGGKDE